MSRLLRGTLVEVHPGEPAILDAVLEIADSSLTYRRRYLTHLQVPAVVDLLVGDEPIPARCCFKWRHWDGIWPSFLAKRAIRANTPTSRRPCGSAPAFNSPTFMPSARRPNKPGPDFRTAGKGHRLAGKKISESVGQIYFSHAYVFAEHPGRRGGGGAKMKYKVVHTTQYSYGDPVPLCHNVLHLKPRPTAHQSLLSDSIAVIPNPMSRIERVDYFGNPITWFSLQEAAHQPQDRGPKARSK